MIAIRILLIVSLIFLLSGCATIDSDRDGDGLTDWDETHKYGTDPTEVDTDGDKLYDGAEVLSYHTDPTKRDSDGGGVSDGFEVNLSNTNPLDSTDDPKEVKRIEMEVLFATNSSHVELKDYKEIEKAVTFMKENPDVIGIIEGHTDNRGSARYNRKLSRKRAEAVRKIMINEYGIDSSRITAVGYGGSRPIAKNNTALGRATNRRINTVFKSR